MAGYIIVRIDVTNPEGMKAYQDAVPASLEAAGGKYLVRGGEVYGPDPDGRRLVVLEFPSAAAAKAWWTSPEYQEIAKLREGHATMDAIVVEGV
ncbi:MAG: DUF1330 domain-containing protein [Alphaproteobacteria bacterium]|nr:DUF1330 domain-containing protein [Alphaproteobacteria bacterium]